MLIDGDLSKPNEEEAHYDFDLFVIGAGSGGVRAARFSANMGAKVDNSTIVVWLAFLVDAFVSDITWVHYIL